jgi:hypothetical protein
MGTVNPLAAIQQRRRFTSTWAARPTFGLQPGDELLVTDFGIAPGLLLVWSGTAWRPFGGRQLVGSLVGSFGNPVAVVSGVTTTTRFGTVEIPVPGDLLNQVGMIARPMCYVTRSGSTANVAPPVAGTGTASMAMRLGTTKTTADLSMGGTNFATGTLAVTQDGATQRNADGTRTQKPPWLPDAGSSTSAAVTQVAGAWTAGTNFLTAWIDSPTASGDGFRLLKLQLWIEG